MKSLLFMLLVSLNVYALDMNSAYQDGTQTAISHANQPSDLLKSLDLNQFPGYQKNLPQEHYYNGVTQENTTLESDAQTTADANESGKAINDSFNHRPLYQINHNSESMQRLHQIAENGEAILKGQNTDKTTCSLKPKECHYSWQEKTCTTSKGLGSLHCARYLRVEVAPYKTENYRVYLQHMMMRQTPYKITIYFAQTNTCHQGNNPCYMLYKDLVQAPPLVLPPQCAQIKVRLVDTKGIVVLEKTANCSQPYVTLSVGKCFFGRCTVPYFHDVTMTVEIYQGKEHWDDHCQSLQNKTQQGLCRISEPLTCTEPNQTRIIDGISYTRPCWKERATFSCGDDSSNTCQSLIQQGCEQVASSCIKETAGHCLSYQQTYQCPINQCSENQLLCGENVFCLDGNCASHQYTPASEEDFKKAVSNLSAVSEASKDFDGSSNFIFKGQLLECSNLIAGVKNCCRGTGWGIDLNLLHCSDLEKKLGKARENKLVVPTGEYCFNRKKFPGGSVCLEHHETFCVFQSKLARIIQEQGRRNQLQIGFGQGKDSNCSGITPEQMQLIHFEAIDFSEFYSDIQNRLKTPNQGQTSQGISQRLKDFYNQGDING